MNHGFSWDRGEHTHWRILNGELGEAQPKLIVPMIGTNNLDRGDSVARVAEGVRSLLADLRKSSSKRTTRTA
jgi:hypothetical protein